MAPASLPVLQQFPTLRIPLPHTGRYLRCGAYPRPQAPQLLTTPANPPPLNRLGPHHQLQSLPPRPPPALPRPCRLHSTRLWTPSVRRPSLAFSNVSTPRTFMHSSLQVGRLPCRWGQGGSGVRTCAHGSGFTKVEGSHYRCSALMPGYELPWLDVCHQSIVPRGSSQ